MLKGDAWSLGLNGESWSFNCVRLLLRGGVVGSFSSACKRFKGELILGELCDEARNSTGVSTSLGFKGERREGLECGVDVGDLIWFNRLSRKSHTIRSTIFG